jgi:hypothetical protein
MVMEAIRLMRKPLAMVTLSSRAREQASGLDLRETGTCGGGKNHLKYGKGF